MTNANLVFDKIAAGTADAEIVRVFGAANSVTAKRKYANARTAMNTLKGSNKVLTDRSGYNDEADLGGLTDDQQISLSPDTIDNPDKRESVVDDDPRVDARGNFGDVGDDGVYIDRIGEFPLSPSPEKLPEHSALRGRAAQAPPQGQRRRSGRQARLRRVQGVRPGEPGADLHPGRSSAPAAPRRRRRRRASRR